MCPDCAMEQGLHERTCPRLKQGWDALSRKSPNLQDALEDRGYLALLCVGVGTRPDGMASIKVAADPGIRNLRGTLEWQHMRRTIIGAIDQLMRSELDDLEIES